MSTSERLTRGKMAVRSGVNIATIRYYEDRGLLLQAPRTQSGYRVYDGDALRRLQFIRQAQALGFTLEEIGELLSLRMQPGTTCGDIQRRAKEKITAIQIRIQDLQRIRDALNRLAIACRGNGPTSECPIIEALETVHPQ